MKWRSWCLPGPLPTTLWFFQRESKFLNYFPVPTFLNRMVVLAPPYYRDIEWEATRWCGITMPVIPIIQGHFQHEKTNRSQVWKYYVTFWLCLTWQCLIWLIAWAWDFTAPAQCQTSWVLLVHAMTSIVWGIQSIYSFPTRNYPVTPGDKGILIFSHFYNYFANACNFPSKF